MEELIGNYYFLYPLVAHVIVTLIKAIDAARQGKLGWVVLVKYGGFPSSHAAVVSSLATIVGIKEGIDSIAFAITFILAILIIRDAFGLRMVIERHGVALDQLSQKTTTPLSLTQDVGHSMVEVIAGTVLGIAITVAITWL